MCGVAVNTAASVAVLASRAAENTDYLQFLCAAVISCTQKAFLLNHVLSSLLCLLDNLDQSPTLVLGQRTGLHYLYLVADLALVVLVVRLQLIGVRNNLLVQRFAITLSLNTFSVRHS